MTIKELTNVVVLDKIRGKEFIGSILINVLRINYSPKDIP